MSAPASSTALTRWGMPLSLIAIGAGLSIFVALQPIQGPRPTTGVLTGLPALALLILFVIRAASGEAGRIGDLVTTLLIAFLVGLHILFLAVSLGMSDRLDRAIPLFVAVLFIALAPAVASLEPASPMGLRVKATLEGEHVWRRTHRRLGAAFALAGLLGAATLALDPMAAVLVTGGLPLLAMIALALSSAARGG